MNIKHIKVVSIDMFGTLADVNSRYHVIWQAFLADKYSDELADKYWERANEVLFQYYDRAIQGRQYIPPKVLFEKCYSTLFAEISLDYDPKQAALVLANQHQLSEPFDDAMLFLNAVREKYTICLSSDTDEDMLGPLKQWHHFDCIFTSEQLGSYKTGVDGRFFKEVVKHYGVNPGEIIHIGDSSSDIIGANEAGIVTCWLNRDHRKWAYDVKPDYEVNSLIDAALILEVSIDPK